MLEARNIHKAYGSVEVLKGVDISIQEGEIVSIVGSSGAGKTSLLHILGTLDQPDQGEIMLHNTRVTGMGARQLSAFRNQYIGFVFQFHHLLPEFSSLENVCIPGWIAKRNKKEVESRALQLLQQLGLGHRVDHKPAAFRGRTTAGGGSQGFD
ncbi:ABC transporter ATP-binding protein [Flavihumibacter sp. CACIAM 22H1]|uniref:ABC transporter ATP-binding protein n=1 Tax=Flavihumibacter sp. CACIAM 22H1 TaxID=1812911 RepID=UPI000AEDD925|nr:ABC transporter ATP-binding protein [Flavihumibacter sp. CACIAM 22H1]